MVSFVAIVFCADARFSVRILALKINIGGKNRWFRK